jgi:pentatricopeptide repeat protein
VLRRKALTKLFFLAEWRRKIVLTECLPDSACNVLISGVCKLGNFEKALKYFYDMGEKGFVT